MDLGESYSQSLAASLIIAAYFNLGLLGILVIQTYTYYLAFPHDRLLAKILVYAVLVLEITQTVLVSHDVYAALAASIDSTSASTELDAMHQHWLSIPVFGGLTGGIGQFFFAYRLWRMTEGNVRGAPIIIGTLASASVVSALVAAQTFFSAKTFTTLLNDGDGVESLAAIGVWNGIGAICDIVIALTMPYYIMRHGTGLKSTHVMIVNVVRLIIETGVLTAIIAILHLCLYFSNMAAFLVPGIAISKVYANTMMVLLNNRMKIIGSRIPTDDDDLELSSSPLNPAGPTDSVTSGNRSIGSGGVIRSPTANRSTSRIVVSNNRLTFRLDAFDERQQQQRAREQGMDKMRSSTDLSTKSSIVFAKPKPDVPQVPPRLDDSDKPMSEISAHDRV